MTLQYSNTFLANQLLFQENLSLRKQLNTMIIRNNNLQNELDKRQKCTPKMTRSTFFPFFKKKEEEEIGRGV